MNHKLYLIPGRNNNNLRCANDITVMAESEKELKRFLIREKGESEKPMPDAASQEQGSDNVNNN